MLGRGEIWRGTKTLRLKSLLSEGNSKKQIGERKYWVKTLQEFNLKDLETHLGT